MKAEDWWPRLLEVLDFGATPPCPWVPPGNLGQQNERQLQVTRTRPGLARSEGGGGRLAGSLQVVWQRPGSHSVAAATTPHPTGSRMNIGRDYLTTANPSKRSCREGGM